ncbi:MAG: sporulation membrane protein YtaF [Oscillospiraceae bacterium]|nr:sporulation membrane protein YtaF [Oscillospiraceae bacterium]
MRIIITLMFAIAANLDTLGMSIAYGIKNIKFKIYSYFMIAFVSTLGTFISMYIGFTITKFINSSYLSLIGSISLMLIGLWFIKDFFVKNNKKEESVYKDIIVDPSAFDEDNSGDVNFKESLTLSFALTINNLGVGIGASIVGLNIILTSIFTFIVTILLLLIGLAFGKKYLYKKFGKYSPLIAGILIILIAIYEIL